MEPDLSQYTCPNTPEGIQKLLGRIPQQVPLVLEPTGRYGDLLVKQATSAGRRVLLAPPKRAKAFLLSINDRAKTDRLDSRGLALFGLSVPLRLFPVKDARIEQVEQLQAARKGLGETITNLEMQRSTLP